MAMIASSPAVRVMTSHMSGAAWPNSPNTVVNTTGNGFQDGPPDSDSEMCEEAIS